MSKLWWLPLALVFIVVPGCTAMQLELHLSHMGVRGEQSGLQARDDTGAQLPHSVLNHAFRSLLLYLLGYRPTYGRGRQLGSQESSFP